MIALVLLCSLLALGAVAEEVVKSVSRALALRRVRKACAWHAVRVTVRYQ